MSTADDTTPFTCESCQQQFSGPPCRSDPLDPDPLCERCAQKRRNVLAALRNGDVGSIHMHTLPAAVSVPTQPCRHPHCASAAAPGLSFCPAHWLAVTGNTPAPADAEADADAVALRIDKARLRAEKAGAEYDRQYAKMRRAVARMEAARRTVKAALKLITRLSSSPPTAEGARS